MEVLSANQFPTKSVILPFSNSLYKECCEFYEKSGRDVQKWQSNLLKSILAVNEDGLWTHTKCAYSLPRRNGKNEIVVMRELFGLLKGERILHTAHRTHTSHTAFEKLLFILDRCGIEYNSLRATGRERVEIGCGRVEFRTRSSKGGLGEGFDLLVIDEAQEYTDDQESALKYVVTDSKNPQTLFCGTPPTPLSSGTVFTKLRQDALEGRSRNTFWAEWSVDEIVDVYDKKYWYNSNPSLGYVFTERSVSDEIGQDVLDFNIQRLGYWVTYNQKSAISVNEWQSLCMDSLPNFKSSLFVGIKYGYDNRNVAMSVAVKCDDGRVFVECIDIRDVRGGNGWILSFISKADVSAVVIDGQSGQSILKEELNDIGFKNVVLPTVKEIVSANFNFEQGVFLKNIVHNNQPSLAEVVSNCDKRPIGSSGGFGYRALFEEHDICLMDSVILANWAAIHAREAKRQRVIY